MIKWVHIVEILIKKHIEYDSQQLKAENKGRLKSDYLPLAWRGIATTIAAVFAPCDVASLGY